MGEVTVMRTQAGEGVGALDVHRATAADSLSAASSEGESGINLVLHANQCIQHHGSRLVKIELVLLHVRLLLRLVRVPAVDLELLHACRL